MCSLYLSHSGMVTEENFWNTDKSSSMLQTSEAQVDEVPSARPIDGSQDILKTRCPTYMAAEYPPQEEAPATAAQVMAQQVTLS